MKKLPSPKEYEKILTEIDCSNDTKITLTAAKILDLKLEQELLINKLEEEEENTNNIQLFVLLAKHFLVIRHLSKVLNNLNQNSLE